MTHVLPKQDALRTPSNDDTLLYNAARFGFCIGGAPLIGQQLSVEDTILTILQDCKQPRLIEGIIVLVAKNKIEYDSLLQKAYTIEKRIPGIVNSLGWILDEARASFQRLGVSHDPALTSAIDSLYSQRRTDTLFFVGTEDATSDIDYEETFRGEFPRKWNVLYVTDNSSMDKYLWTYGVVASWTRK
ncbi:hypothetical protein HY483_00140 [Candidatus Woesearchaeota archaeon]|nr:hypothetical protein [Candidatus Woesearchaeota archaeon]